ncbi:MAG: hypothetical protein ACI8UO_005929 [Verrucomicrobiales bacterium]|jgi:hypothetical protein
MRLNSSKSRLGSVSKELKRQWESTKIAWRDQKADEFEQRYLVALFDAAENALAAIDKLDKVITKVRNDCKEEG